MGSVLLLRVLSLLARMGHDWRQGLTKREHCPQLPMSLDPRLHRQHHHSGCFSHQGKATSSKSAFFFVCKTKIHFLKESPCIKISLMIF